MRPIRILYVEDNDYLREVLGDLLGGAQREILMCATAEEAIVHLRKQRIDVLVTDVSLPGLSGTDLARLALGEYPNIWVVLCSGYDFGCGWQSLGRNVRSLSKPFEADEFEVLVKEVIASLDHEE